MNKDRYEYASGELLLRYMFTSNGTKGSVKKMVEYTETETKNVFNMAFGDYDNVTKNIDDLAVTNNGDSRKVLATVAATVFVFTERYPEAWIFATGSTPVRTRLYRIGIMNHIVEISKEFAIFGYTEQEEWEKFVVNKQYDGFLLTRKNNWQHYENN
jgi:hypothetical protein